MALQHSVMPLDGGGFVVTVIAETPAVLAALRGRIEGIKPSAFIPERIPHDLAAALLRDCPPEDNAAPPVDDVGNPITPIVLADENPADDDEVVFPRSCSTGGCDGD